MASSLNPQQDICLRFGAAYLPSDGCHKVGISKKFNSHEFPINGLRHPPTGDTTGWYVWSGKEYSADPAFFVPLHAVHLNDRCPTIVKYLGLGPGWRLLITPDHEEVW